MREHTSIDRRSYLKATGVALGASVGGTGIAVADYDNVVNIVEAGADNSGEEPIDAVFSKVADDDTLVEFPEGEYLVRQLSLYGLRNFAMRATGDATLVADSTHNENVWIGGSSTENLAVEGFTLDHTDDGANPLVFISATDGLLVRDIEKNGSQSDSTAFSFRITDADGTGLVENLRAPDGGSTVGVYCETTGTMTFRDCHVEGFGNNGLYASNSEGPVQVEYGLYKNNDVDQIRLGSPDSYVKGADVHVEDSDHSDGNLRGIRVADGPGPVIIEDCDIRMEDGQGGGGIVGAYSCGSFEVRKTRIYVGRDYTTTGTDYTSMAVLVDTPDDGVDAGERVFEDVYVTGEGVGYGAMLVRRDNNRFENVNIIQSGENRKGIIFTDESQNNTIVSASIDVPGEQIAEFGSASVQDLDSDPDRREATIGDEENDGEQTETDGESSTDSDDTTSESSSSDDSDSGSGDSNSESDSSSNDSGSSSSDSDGDSGSSSSDSDSDTESSSSDSDSGSSDLEWSGMPLVSPGDETYAVAGTDEDNPTAVLYGSYKCPYTAEAVNGNLEAIVDEFVREGDLNLEYRTLAYDVDDPENPYIGTTKEGQLAAQVGLAIWNVEPESFWQFFKHVYAVEPDNISLETMTELMAEAGVSSREQVRSLVSDDRYVDDVKATTEAAQEDDVPFVPRLVLDGDAIAAHRDQERVLEWIGARL